MHSIPALDANIHAVKKMLVIVLLTLLTFQFSWAAAAVYCQHESETAQHFGHHNHQHESLTELSSDDGDQAFQADEDCGYCHLSCQAPFLMTQPEIAAAVSSSRLDRLSLSFSSHTPEGLQRPDWRLVA